MPYHSGWFLERTDLGQGNFEALTACPPLARGLVHVAHTPSVPFTAPEIWREVSRIRSAGFPGPFLGASILRSSYGNLEAVCAQVDGTLAHFWKSESGGWRGPIVLPARAAGAPAFIQGRYGSAGNFEVLVPQAGGGLAHLWRDNDHGANVHWRSAQHDPDGRPGWSGVALLFASSGNLEVVGVRKTALIGLTQNGVGGPWRPTAFIGTRATGRPALIQTTYGHPGDFDLVVAKAGGGLAHYWRNNAVPARPWSRATLFGPAEMVFDDVSIIQSSSGGLEVLARLAGRSICKRFRRPAPDARWDGPYTGPSFSCDP
jgi:hypothetical protein